jgi:hypothetical protein
MQQSDSCWINGSNADRFIMITISYYLEEIERYAKLSI